MAAVGVPDTNGVLALSVVFGLMVALTHRPPQHVVWARWLPSVLAVGLAGELLVGVSRAMALASGAPALATWLACVGTYELAPAIAAGAGVTARERRSPAIDVVAHTSFVLLALTAYTWDARAGWYVSPWMAAAVALPLATVHCGATSPLHLAPARDREGITVGLALLAWLVVAALFLGDLRDLSEAAARAWRFGTDAREGLLWTFPVLSFVLSIAAALSLLVRAPRVRSAPFGRVNDVHDDGITLERAGDEEPSWVVIERGPMPRKGELVTLIGVAPQPADVGPFRDGAPRLRAARAWVGTPDELARALAYRAAVWLAVAALGTLGIWLRLVDRVGALAAESTTLP